MQIIRVTDEDCAILAAVNSVPTAQKQAIRAFIEAVVVAEFKSRKEARQFLHGENVLEFPKVGIFC